MVAAGASGAARGSSAPQTLAYKGPVGGDSSEGGLFFFPLPLGFGNAGGALVRREGRGGGDSASSLALSCAEPSDVNSRN